MSEDVTSTLGLGVLAALGAVAAIVALAFFILTIIGRFKVFEKMGLTPWHAIIPFLAEYDLFGAFDGKTAAMVGLVLSLLQFLIPDIGFVISVAMLIYEAIRLSEGFGTGVGAIILYVLFSPFVWLYYGFSALSWDGSVYKHIDKMLEGRARNK